MYAVITTKRYRKALRTLSRSGKSTDIEKLEEVVSMLVSGKLLPARLRDHSLTGDLTKYRECHIRGDLLLTYYKQESELILVLVNLGSHDELFK